MRLDFRARAKLDRGPQQTFVGADAREERRGRGHDQARGAGRRGVQCAGPRRGDAEMRRHASIRIDLNRRKREHGLLDHRRGRTLERAVEESRVRRHLLDVSIGRDDQERHAGARTRGADRRERLACRRQARGDRRATEGGGRDGFAEQRPQGKRRRRGRHVLTPRDLLHEACRGEPLGEFDAHNCAAACFNDVAADDVVRVPVGSLDEDIGLDRRNHRLRCVFVEDRHRVDAAQGGNDLRSLVLRVDRPRRSLVGAHRAVGVDRDDQRVAERACVDQIAHVSRMQKIEDAVGEDDAASLRANAVGQHRHLLSRQTARRDGFHRPEIRMPLENVHRCGGRTMPISFTLDVTRMV